jgi:hypothetical protein
MRKAKQTCWANCKVGRHTWRQTTSDDWRACQGCEVVERRVHGVWVRVNREHHAIRCQAKQDFRQSNLYDAFGGIEIRIQRG